MNDDERERIIAEVAALYARGLAPRTTVEVPSGATTRLRVSALFLECAVCGVRVPQSRSRQAPEARATWIGFHLRCEACDA